MEKTDRTGVTMTWTQEEAQDLLRSLEMTTSVAGESALNENCDGVNEYEAIDKVDRFVGQLRPLVEESE